MKRCLMTLIVFVLCLAPLGADLTFTQTMTIEGPMAAAMAGKPMVLVTSVKGTKARGDMDVMEMKISTLTDISTKEIMVLNHKEKTAQVLSAMSPVASMPQVDVDVTFKPTGQTRAIEGVPCAEHVFKLSLGFAEMAGQQASKEGQPAVPKEAVEMMKDVRMLMDGSIWIATSGPGAEEYIAFQKAAAAANLTSVFGGMFGGQQSRGGMDKLIAAVSEAPGLPYLTEMTMAVEGTGQVVDLIKNQFAGMKMVQKITSISSDPVADDLFEVPAGYTIKK